MRFLTPRSLLLSASITILAACGSNTETPGPVAAPQAPALTVTVGLKQLRFSWSPVTGAESYQLMTDASGSGTFSPVDGSLSATTTQSALDVAVHSLDWARARYALSACNSGGCTQSAPLAVADQSVKAVGYVKASDTSTNAQFGWAVAVSADGSTAAVAAPGRQSNSGGVYVFVRQNGAWTQQAQVQGLATEPGDRFGESLALSANGDTLAVGAPLEDSAATGVNGDQRSNGRPESGAVYVFVRASAAWTQQAFLKASNADTRDTFGQAVTLSADGNTLAAGAPLEDSGTDRVNGAEKANNAPDAGAAYVFVRSGSSWSQQAYIKTLNTDAGDWLGYSLALSGDGNTLAVGAPFEDSNATGIDGKQSNNATTKAGAVYLFGRSGSSWSQSVYVKASNTDTKDWFGWAVALSSDGATLAVAAPEEDGAYAGIDGDQRSNGKANSGAVYVFALSGGTWLQQAYIKASNPDSEDELGWALALSENGSALAVGAPGESSPAIAVGGNQFDNSSAQAGAAYTFTRSGSTWRQQAYVKASNTGAGDHFGRTVALSRAGDTLLVGAPDERSAATGIGGAQTDDSRSGAGAAYLF